MIIVPLYVVGAAKSGVIVRNAFLYRRFSVIWIPRLTFWSLKFDDPLRILLLLVFESCAVIM